MAVEDDIAEQIAGLRRYARALVGDRGCADNLVRDTLERSLRDPTHFRRGTDPRRWLMTNMHSVFSNDLREASRQTPPKALDEGEIDHAEYAVSGSQTSCVEVHDLDCALQRLSKQQREVVLMVSLEGMSYAEVAVVLGIPVSTVMSRLSRGRERLRKFNRSPAAGNKARSHLDVTRETQSGTVHSIEERLRTLLIQSLEGDAASYRAFLQDLTGHLRALLRKRLHYLPHDVEDVVQEVLLAVHNGRHTWRPDQPLTAWINAIARYKLVDYLRARSRREALQDPLDDEVEIFAASDTEPADAKRDVHKLLDLLPNRQRLPIVHVKLQGLSVEETSRLTGLSESAVKVGVHRGLRALARKIRGIS